MHADSASFHFYNILIAIELIYQVNKAAFVLTVDENLESPESRGMRQANHVTATLQLSRFYNQGSETEKEIKI